jgi:hypothetical protein
MRRRLRSPFLAGVLLLGCTGSGDDAEDLASLESIGSHAVPGRIEAENYDTGGEGVGYHDTTPGNTGGKYRNGDVDIEVTSDVGGGYNVGWTDVGEWLAYTVSVSDGGRFAASARIASRPTASKRVHLVVDGTAMPSVTFTTTNGWQSWSDLSLGSTHLAPGAHHVVFFEDSGGFNLNYIEFKQTCVATTCAAEGNFCGTIADGCGATLQCTCSSGFTCVSNQCQRPYKVGATINPSLWPSGTTMAQAISQFDHWLSTDGIHRDMAARVEKVFHWNDLTSLTSRETDAIAAGGKLIVAFYPSQTLSNSERTKLAQAIQQFKDAYVNAGMPAHSFDAVLASEPNDGKFSSGSAYKAYVAYYADVITSAGIKLIYDPGAGGGVASWSEYFPPQAQGILIDYYGSAYKAGQRLDALVSLADAHNLSLGIGEWNNVAVGDTPLTQVEWDSYVNYLITVMKPRKNAGTMGDLLFFMGPVCTPNRLHQLGGNTPYDPIINIRKLYDALN